MALGSSEKLAIVLIVAMVAGVVYWFSSAVPLQNPAATLVASSELKQFETWENVSSFLNSVPRSFRGDYYIEEFAMPLSAIASTGASAPAKSTPDYSTTNVQVSGVDEEDVLKSDGRYLYTISGDKLVILAAYPPQNASVVATLNDSAYTGLFINGDRLVAFGSDDFDWQPIVEPLQRRFVNQSGADTAIARSSRPYFAPDFPYYYSGSSFVKIFDMSNRSSPVLLKKIQLRGSVLSSRMIGNKVYVVFSEPASPELPMPLYAVDGEVKEFAPGEISYFDEPFETFDFTTVLGFDITDLTKEEQRKVVLTGGGQELFVSLENAYITYTHYNYYYETWPAYDVILSLLPNETKSKLAAIDDMDISQWRKDNLKVVVAQAFLDSLNESTAAQVMQSMVSLKRDEIMRAKRNQPESTVAHKFSLANGISYSGKAEVPGHVLNQFSMDEANGYFRIATTTGDVSQSEENNARVSNALYVLNSSLVVVGKIENLAPGEKIYSARFMGNRAYLVTFKKVDPLFVIGLDDPTNPQLLGKLKIPGYSDYLHPYDETHLIGLGKDAIPAEEGDFAWFQGVKLSLFDVSNVSNPIELASYKIGDRGTDSLALNDHKAFLFDKTRNLLVVPITLYEINQARNPNPAPTTYGEFTFQGAYVFNVTLSSGFNLRSRIAHIDNESIARAGDFYYGSDGTQVKRSAYIGEYLYTVSDKFVKANVLSTLENIASVELPFEQQVYDYIS